jgi:hypothetical protein
MEEKCNAKDPAFSSAMGKSALRKKVMSDAKLNATAATMNFWTSSNFGKPRSFVQQLLRTIHIFGPIELQKYL